MAIPEDFSNGARVNEPRSESIEPIEQVDLVIVGGKPPFCYYIATTIICTMVLC